MAKVKARIEEFRPDPRLVDERGATPERARKVSQSPVNLMLAAEKLTRDQGLAAEKLYKHWYQGGMAASLHSIEIDRVFGGDGYGLMPRTENEAFHRDRYRKAKAEIEGSPRFGAVGFWTLEMVVCHEKPLTEIGALFGHKNRTRAAQVAYDLFVPPLEHLVGYWGIR